MEMEQNSAMAPQKTDIKTLIAGFLGIFFFGMSFIVIGAVLPSLQAKLGLTHGQVSTLASLLPLGVLFGSLIFGPIIDRYGYKRLLIVAVALGVAGLEILAFSVPYGQLVIAALLIGISGGMLNGSTSALVSDISSDKGRTQNLFIHGLIYCVGAFTIPMIMASASAKFDYTPIVAVAGALMALTLIYLFLIRFPEAKCKQGISAKAIFGMIKEPTLLLFAFTLFFQSALEGLASNWTNTYLLGNGLTAQAALYALTFITVGMGISRLILTGASRLLTPRAIILGSMTLTIAGAICLFFADSPFMGCLSAILVGLGLSATFPMAFSIIGVKYSKMSGTAFSFCLVVALIGNTILNKLLGVVGVQWLPWFMAISVVLLVALFIAADKAAKAK